MALTASITTQQTGAMPTAYANINHAAVSLENNSVSVSLAIFDSEASHESGARERFAIGVAIPLSALSQQALDVLRTEIYNYLNSAERDPLQAEVETGIDLRTWSSDE